MLRFLSNCCTCQIWYYYQELNLHIWDVCEQERVTTYTIINVHMAADRKSRDIVMLHVLTRGCLL